MRRHFAARARHGRHSARRPVTVRRFFNRTNGGHFWTASTVEEEDLLNNKAATYAYEGMAWTVDSSATDTLWRARNTRTGAHFYTTSRYEFDHLPPEYVQEGEAYRVSATSRSGYRTVYRAYNTKTGIHFYTAGYEEFAGLPWYYNKEGAAFWLPPANPYVNTGVRWPRVQSVWPQYEVRLNRSYLSTADHAAAEAARQQWNSVGLSQLYFYFTLSDAHTIAYSYPSPLFDPAWTARYYSGDTLLDADVWVNRDQSYSRLDRQSLLTHEFGHCVEMGDDGPGVFWCGGKSFWWMTMHGFQGDYDTYKRSLAVEDIDGIRIMYGAKP